uniref:protein kinase domain-containing protein n=1 Tax=Aquipuribacter sp. SD81 TaxID=3127703 RepID=UPI003019CA12
MIGKRPVLDGRYELGEPLGTGGMAVVRRARDLRLGREVAVKLLHPEVAMDPEAMAAFRAEAMSAARLNHPGVVAVHDVGEAVVDGAPRPYLVMEMIEGQPLSHLLVDGTPLTVERALEIGVDVTSALAHAHERGLVHRDVTPHNLMVLRDGSVKVTDFGIARAMPTLVVDDAEEEWTEELAEAGSGFGSVAYLSPEQARRGFVDARSDLYSVGCLLMTVLTGYPPFRGSPRDVVRHHLRTLPPTPSSRRPGLEPAIDGIVARALQKDPWQRPQSAAEMRRDLLQVLGDIDAPAAWAAGAHGLATAVAPHEPQRMSEIVDLATQPVDLVTGAVPDSEDETDGAAGSPGPGDGRGEGAAVGPAAGAAGAAAGA